MLSKFYIIGHPNHPWGDYGDTLSQGMAHRNRDGVLELRRTGPFVPPVTLPGIGEIVVTEQTRRDLTGAGLEGITFEPVAKRLIVQSNWHTWDQSADEPPEHPETGEPEGYVLDQPHSEAVDEEMGDLWAIEFNGDAKTHRERRIVENRREIKLLTATWGGQDIFGAQDVGFIYVTEKAKDWFERYAVGCLTFEEAVTAAE